MDNLQSLNEALALQMGVMRFVDGYTIGKNNGGIYIKLFSSKAKYVICTVYDNDFRKLPKEIADKAMLVGSRLEAQEESVTQLDVAKKKGMLNQMPLMMITRFQYDPAADKEKWRFWGIYKIFEVRKPQQETQAPTNGNGHTNEDKKESNPVFSSSEDAMKWAVDKGAYQTVEQAKVALTGLYNQHHYEKADLFYHWVNAVEKILEEREKRKEKAR